MSLKSSVVNMLCGTYAQGPRIITVQLCLSLSALMLQMDCWQNPFEEVIQTLMSAEKNLLLLLEVLPEEVRNNNLIPVPVRFTWASYA